MENTPPDKDDIRDEYLDASSNVRHHGNLRFAQLTLFSGLTGALISVIFGHTPPPLRPSVQVSLEFLGLIVAGAFLVIEWRTGIYWEHYRARAAALEPLLGYQQYQLLPRRTGLITARNATRTLYFVIIALWILALLFGPSGWLADEVKEKTMEHAKGALNFFAVCAGLVSAAMWWGSASITKKNMEPFMHQPLNGPARFPYLERVGWWNKWAAVASGVSIFLSALANSLL